MNKKLQTMCSILHQKTQVHSKQTTLLNAHIEQRVSVDCVYRRVCVCDGEYVDIGGMYTYLHAIVCCGTFHCRACMTVNVNLCIYLVSYIHMCVCVFMQMYNCRCRYSCIVRVCIYIFSCIFTSMCVCVYVRVYTRIFRKCASSVDVLIYHDDVMLIIQSSFIRHNIRLNNTLFPSDD